MNNKLTTKKWLYLKVKPFIPHIFLISLFNVISALLYIYLADLSQKIIDNAANYSKHVFAVTSALIFAVIIVHIIIESANSVFYTVVTTKMNISLKNYMFSAIMKKRYANISEYHSGDLLNRFTSDINVVVSGSIGLIPSAVSMLTKIIVGFAALCAKNYIFAVIVLGIGFVFPLIGRLISKKYKQLHKEVQQTEGISRSFLQECFANIVVVKTFCGEKPFLLKLNELLKENFRLTVKRSIFSVIISSLLYVFFTLGYYGVLVWGAAQIATGAITIGTLVYFLQIISILRTPLQNISGIIPKYYSTVASAERLIELENLENESLQTAQPQIINFKKIIAQNLTFAYNREIILKNNTFEIEHGHITAITGHSGSGKSTFFKLLLGLFTLDGGSLTFDEKTAIDETTRYMFSYVPQGNMVISGTIRDNISLCDKSVPEEKIINAAKNAVIYDYIQTLPNGFDTVISERGQGLSEGQIQRIAIARALLFDAPIILLDEATSALDENTETQLLENLKNFTDKTIIFITHRNTSLGVCDKILNLNDGVFREK